MARRTFDVIDVCEIFTHWHAGRSKNEVAGSLGLARNTVRKYVAAAEAAGMVPGGPPVSQERWAELAREWFPELADTRLRRQPTHTRFPPQLRGPVMSSNQCRSCVASPRSTWGWRFASRHMSRPSSRST